MGPVNRCNGQGSSESGGICQKFLNLKTMEMLFPTCYQNIFVKLNSEIVLVSGNEYFRHFSHIGFTSYY